MAIRPYRIFSGSAHPELAQEIASIIGIPLGRATTVHLPDSEIHVMIEEVVREQDIFFIQPCSVPVNDNLMELLLYLDAFRRASVSSVSAVIPYFPYARQDRMVRGREAISARVVANLIESMGASRVIFYDIHNRAIQGFFNIPVDPLTALPLLANYFRKPEFANAAIVSPDVGRTSLAGKYAEQLDLPLVPIIIDDLMAGGSVLKQIDVLYARGAEGKAFFAITHPILLPSAIRLLEQNDRIEKLVVTNTIPLPEEIQIHPKIEVISVATHLADVIDLIHEGKSISTKLVLS